MNLLIEAARNLYDFIVDVFTFLDPILWVGSNLLIAYIAVALIVFVAAYPRFFNPHATTAGRFVFKFAGSLVGVIGLVFIGVFVDPQLGREWWQFPGDVLWWRPLVRFVAYLYVAYTVTGLVVVLWLRRFRPNKLKTAPGEQFPIKVRNEKTRRPPWLALAQPQ